MSVVTLELDHGGRRRSVQVYLGAPIRLPGREPARSLVLRTDARAESRGMVELLPSWDFIMASAVTLLDFEGRNRRKAAT